LIAKIFDCPHAAAYQIPKATWARRVRGVFGNDLANRAQAAITKLSDGNVLVSVYAALNNKRGADEACRQFATAGGHAATARINQLPEEKPNHFINTFSDFYK